METDDLIIKIPRHIWTIGNVLPESREKKADFDVLERIGIHIALTERESAYGKTKIQTFALEDDDGKKIVELLNNSILYERIPKIFDYICKMGQASASDNNGNDNETRDFAAMSVSILSEYFPFDELERGILTKWARRMSPRSNRSAALALVKIIKYRRHQEDVINLLNYWSCQPRIGFANTVLLTYSEIVDTHPNDTLNIIKNIFSNEEKIVRSSQEALSLSDDREYGTRMSWRTIASKISQLTKDLYLNHPVNVIDILHQWFRERSNYNLTIFAALTFLSIIDLCDIAKDGEKRAKTIAYIYDLWEDKEVPEHEQLQQLNTKSVYSWAKTVLEMESTESDRTCCQQFFHELYQKCASARQNRLDFHLRRWQRQVQQRGQSTSSSQQLDFLSLIPGSKQS